MDVSSVSSVFEYQGWKVQYKVSTSSAHSDSQPQQNAKAVAFVHGTPWSSAVFQPVVKALLASRPYRILTYDLPGYGESQDYQTTDGNKKEKKNGFEGDTSVKFQAATLSALLKHTRLDGRDGNPTPAVVAHDIAGTIVLRAHLLHGSDFDSMLLADANCVLPWGDGFYTLARDEPRAFTRLPPDIFEAVVRAVTRSAVHNPSVLQEQQHQQFGSSSTSNSANSNSNGGGGWADVIARPWTGSVERQRSFVRQIAQATDADVAEMLEGNRYADFRCDVKLVWGEEDRWIPGHKVEDLARRMGARVRQKAYIPDAGHLVMLDQPERFAIEVFDWLARFGTDRSLVKS